MSSSAASRPRIAVYKVCWIDGGADHEILSAVDDAIADGVDINQPPFGEFSTTDYFSDPITIGSFHAMKDRIFTSTSAGNQGPSCGIVFNVAPWMLLSVVASSTN